MKVAIINDTSTDDGHFGCELVMRNLEEILSGLGATVLWTWPVGKDWREYEEALLAKDTVDLFIVNGEGTIHHSSSSRKMPASLASFAKFALTKMSIPSVLINCTLYMNDEELYEMLSWYKMIYVRDSMSLKELERHRLSATVVPDLSMYHERGFSCFSENERKGVGVTDSYFKAVSDSLRKMSSKNGFDYLPMILNESRNSIFGFRRKELPARDNVRKDFVSWVSSKKFVVTGRYHTVTVCILTRTPFVAVESNTSKISSLLMDVFGSNERIIYDPSLLYLDGEIFRRYDEYSESEMSAINLYLDKLPAAQVDMIRSCLDLSYEGSYSLKADF